AAARRCVEVAWSDLADWCGEAVKPRIAAVGDAPDAPSPSAAAQRAPAASGDAASVAAAHAVLTYCFDAVLCLLHPVVPFITEDLWQKLPGRQPDDLLAIAPWPTVPPTFRKLADDGTFARVHEAISKIRAIRAEYRVAPKTRLAAVIKPRIEAIRAAL